jgi:hypothetical protein
MNPLIAERLHRKARRFRLGRLATFFVSVPTFGVFTLVFVAGTIFGGITLCRIGCAIIATSLACTTYRLLRSDWSVDRTSDCVTHYRAHLIQRRDFLRSFPYWTGFPAAAGAVLATLGWLLAEPNRWFDAATAGILGVGLQVALWAANNRTAAHLQKEIDLLDAP